jgi:hypothetical protein
LNGSALIFINTLGEELGKQKVGSSPDKSGPAAPSSKGLFVYTFRGQRYVQFLLADVVSHRIRSLYETKRLLAVEVWKCVTAGLQNFHLNIPQSAVQTLLLFKNIIHF